MPTDNTTDSELVTRHVAGDAAALASIYDRYGGALYDAAAAMLADRDDAADIVQDVFVIATEHLGELRDPTRLKPWLFAIMRNEVYRRTHHRSRTVPIDFGDQAAAAALPATEATDSAALEQQELAELVRAAAAGLDARDQLVLEFNVRAGLDGRDLADALGVSTQQCASLLHRMRQRTERSLGAYCVARMGRRDCPELASILRGWNGEFSTLVRKRVARHVDRCETCERSRRKFAAIALVGAAPAFAAPRGLRERVTTAAAHSTRLATTSYGFWASGGFPAAVHTAVLGWLLVASAASLVLAVLVTAFVLADRDDGSLAIVAPATTEADDADGEATAGSTDAGPDGVATEADQGDGREGAAAPTRPPTTTTTSHTSTTTTSTVATSTGITTTTLAPRVVVAPTTGPPTSTAAAAPTSPTTAPVPATIATTTSTTVASTTPTTTPTPGALALSAGAVDFGRIASTASVTLSNTGGLPVAWSTTTAPRGLLGAPSWFTVTPTGGTLAPGASVPVTITFDRAGQHVEGPQPGMTLVFAASGTSATLAVDGEGARAPIIRIHAGEQPLGSMCPTRAEAWFAVVVVEESPPIDDPVLRVSFPDGTVFTATMSLDGEPHAGPFYGGLSLLRGNEPAATGQYRWSITTADRFGNVGVLDGQVEVAESACG